MKTTNNFDISAIASASLAAPVSLILPAGDLPDVMEWQFMPPGRQRITPFVTDANGREAKELEITVSAKYADVFQRAHESMMATAKAGQGDLPYTDFNHDDAGASSRPVRFYWGGEDPIKGGVRVETKLTGSGKSALAGGDYSRFSPQWIFSKKTGEPLGLPVNQGGLVNRAAFKSIAPILSAADAGKMNWALGIAADATCATCGNAPCTCADADDAGGNADALSQAAHKASSKAAVAEPGNAFNAHSDAFQAHTKAAASSKAAGQGDEAKMHGKLADFHKKQAEDIATKTLTASGRSSASQEAAANHNQNPNVPMTEQEIGVISAKAAEAAVKALNPVIESLKTEITALKTQGQDAVKASARSAVMVHVTRGAIAPEAKLPGGKLVVDYWTEQMVASAADAEAVLSQLPGKRPQQRMIVAPGNGGTATANTGVDPEDRIIAAAKDSRKTYPDAFKNDAAALIAVMRTPAGAEAYEAFRNDIKTGQTASRLLTVNVK